MIVFVTCASVGFGAAIARRFAKGGHRIVATGRRGERFEVLAEELGRDKILPLVFDVRDRHAVERAFQELPASFAAGMEIRRAYAASFTPPTTTTSGDALH